MARRSDYLRAQQVGAEELDHVGHFVSGAGHGGRRLVADGKGLAHPPTEIRHRPFSWLETASCREDGVGNHRGVREGVDQAIVLDRRLRQQRGAA